MSDPSAPDDVQPPAGREALTPPRTGHVPGVREGADRGPDRRSRAAGLDRDLAVLAVDPDAGAPIPGSQPGLRDHGGDVDDVGVIYLITALRTLVVVACDQA